ncbi:MAG: L-threonylcarbamoyladenylate synthase [Pseudohongiellaceae bacterium]|nr:L-threonylcarbamoyladenylate synthase [Pseudohongiellaceae bacterium]
MAQFLEIHPQNPEPRLIKQAVQVLLNGGVIVYPTDSTYALGCHLGDKTALERIRRIRRLSDKHNFTLVCADLSAIANYAKVPNSAYRLLKAYTPGAYTFILQASPEVPRRLMHPKRKSIGLRVPQNNVAQALLAELGEPIMSTSLILPDESDPLVDIHEIQERMDKHVDLIIESSGCGLEPTTVIDLIGGGAELIRHGKGDTTPFE